MKVSEIYDIKTGYSFESEIFSAADKAGASGNAETPKPMNLNSYLAPKPDKYFLVHVSGDSMIDARIFAGDILVVERTNLPKNGDIVIAALNSEMAVKKYSVKNGMVSLISANKKFNPIEISDLMTFEVQGVVRHVIRSI